MRLWSEIEAVRSSWDVGRHPFLVGWGAEAPSTREMSVYAASYRQALRALGDGAARLARRRALGADGRLQAAAEREWALADVWEELELEPGGAEPGQAIAECAAVWNGGEAPEPLAGLVILHVVDRARAELAPGLAETLPEGDSARACLQAEAELSLAHAELTRELAERLLAASPPANPGELVSHVEAACSVHWDLLDGIEAALAQDALAHA